MNLFDYVTNINSSKDDIWSETSEKEYAPFLVNRALSYHGDTLMYAQEMNERSHLPKRMQYDFLRTAIHPKKKRFAKWTKPEEDADISLISEAYSISLQQAQTYYHLLNKDEIAKIRSLLSKGGRNVQT